MKTTKFIKITGCTALFVAVSSFYAFDGNNKYFEISKNLDLFAQVYNEVSRSYVDQVEPAGLMKKGVDAMLKDLDPYTNYISEAQIEGYRLNRNAATGDIGVKLISRDDYLTISKVLEDQGAHKAGLNAGDKIVAIGGTSAKGRTIKEAEQALRGQPGSEVMIRVKRAGKNAEEDVVVVRDKEEPKSVTFSGMLDETTGYVKLKTFLKRGCSAEVVGAIQALQKENDVQSLVFDLRSNGGGLLDEAIKMVNIFVPKGVMVVSADGKTEQWKGKKFETTKDALFPDLPLTVLVNDRSASASEIFAGTMQDLDRGVVIGSRSFGKGLVQQTKNIDYGSRLKLTVAKYFTPSGRCVQAVNYSGRYKDGAITIPDSLRKVFKTRNGRTVYDGGGVDPDVAIPKPEYANITQSLLDQHLIFDYATEYWLKNDAITEATKFDFTDKDFDNFSKFLSNKKFTYTTKSEKVLEKLQKSAKNEKYAIDSSLDKLQAKIVAEKKGDLEKHKSEIKKLLRLEIIERFYSQKGLVEASLDSDPTVHKSLHLFANAEEYEGILSGK